MPALSDVVGMLAGAPLVPPNSTLWGRAPNVHVTVPPRAILTVVGVKTLELAPAATVAALGREPVTVAAIVVVLLTPPAVPVTVIVDWPAESPVTTPASETVATLVLAEV